MYVEFSAKTEKQALTVFFFFFPYSPGGRGVICLRLYQVSRVGGVKKIWGGES